MSVSNAFGGPLTCPVCGTRTEGVLPGASTKLLDDAEQFDRVLRAGDRIENLDHRDLEQVYYVVRPVLGRSAARALERWTCPHCQTPGWFVITYGDERIQSMEAVELTRSLLQSVDYLSLDFFDEVFSREPGNGFEHFAQPDSTRMWIPGRVKPGFIERLPLPA